MYSIKSAAFFAAVLLLHIFSAPHGSASPLQESDKKSIPICPLTSSGVYKTYCDPCYPYTGPYTITRSIAYPCKYDLPECSPCFSPWQCKQGKCWGSKCTDGSDESLKNCFKPECDPCKSLLECSTKKCWGNKCVYDTPESMKKCFPVTSHPTVTIYTPYTKPNHPTIIGPCPDGSYIFPCPADSR